MKITKNIFLSAILLSACSDIGEATQSTASTSEAAVTANDVLTTTNTAPSKTLEASVQSAQSAIPEQVESEQANASQNVTGDIKIGIAALNKNDFALAAREFATAFDKGEADGAFYLGRMYETGMGAPVNVAQAIEIYRAGIEKGSASSLNRLGVMHLEGIGVLQDYAEGAKLVCQAADTGETNAQFNCGTLYLDGKGVKADPSKAVSYFQKAAAGNHIAARNFLGLSYLSGKGVNANEAKAVEQFEKTAAQGNLLGMVQLGKYYADEDEKGHRDLELSHMYFNLAASNGHPDAALSRDQVQTLMTNEQIEAAQKKARDWKPTGQ